MVWGVLVEHLKREVYPEVPLSILNVAGGLGNLVSRAAQSIELACQLRKLSDIVFLRCRCRAPARWWRDDSATSLATSQSSSSALASSHCLSSSLHSPTSTSSASSSRRRCSVPPSDVDFPFFSPFLACGSKGDEAWPPELLQAEQVSAVPSSVSSCELCWLGW